MCPPGPLSRLRASQVDEVPTNGVAGARWTEDEVSAWSIPSRTASSAIKGTSLIDRVWREADVR
jgi:hypothetical protein